MNDKDHCLSTEMLAAFGEGTLEGQAFAGAVRHLSRCANCRLIVERSVELEQDMVATVIQTPRSAHAGRWLPVAAAVLLVAITAAFFAYSRRSPGETDPIALLVSNAPHSRRLIESRIQGFGWAPYRNTMGAREENAPDVLMARGAAGKVLNDRKDDHSARALHAKGVAHLLIEEPALAVSELRQTVRAAPDDATAWNDLAAALYTKSAPEDVESLREALTDARRATQLDPRLSAAYFNIALITERVGSGAQIEQAWRDYLQHDATTNWAEEARERLARHESAK